MVLCPFFFTSHVQMTGACRLQVGKDFLQAVVELVKDDYVVLSLPKHKHALGFAAVSDFNLQNQQSPTPLQHGQLVRARVSALPSDKSGMGSRVSGVDWAGLAEVCMDQSGLQHFLHFSCCTFEQSNGLFLIT